MWVSFVGADGTRWTRGRREGEGENGRGQGGGERMTECALDGREVDLFIYASEVDGNVGTIPDGCRPPAPGLHSPCDCLLS